MFTATQPFYRVGNCNNCGRCCTELYNKQTMRLGTCIYYDPKRVNGHCTVWGTPKFPKKCREYPVSPGDLEQSREYCGFSFLSDGGFVVDGYFDPHGIHINPIRRR